MNADKSSVVRRDYERKRRRQQSQRGFTLLEIMIVVLIMAILLNIAMPQFVHARDVAQANACITNLHNINSAKEEWALQYSESPTAQPQPVDIQPYIHTSAFPVCPTTGDRYSINDMSLLPTCSYGQAVNAPAHVF